MLEDRANWTDPATPEAVEALYAAATNLPEGTSAYFLLDAVFAPGLPRWLAERWETDEFCSLYAGRYSGQGIDAIAPYLARFPDATDRRSALYADLVVLTKGKPLLSCLVSELSLEQLTAHLQNQLGAVDAEGTEFLLRFADTRALANLYAVLYPPQKRRLLAGISRWLYVDRQGRLEEIPAVMPENGGHVLNNRRDEDVQALRTQPPDHSDTTPYLIDAGQDLQLERLALNDAILRFAQLRESVMGTLTVSPSAAHSVIDEAAKRLARHGILDEAAAYRNALRFLRRRGCFAKPSATA